MFKLKSRFLVFGLAFVLCVQLPGFVKASDAYDRVTWAQLPYYLESQNISLKNLNLCDCPEGLNQQYPSHHVIQVIGNTRYEWKEFEFINAANETQIAIQMLRPEKRRLSTSEARVLLSASSGLLVRSSRVRGVAATVPIPDESLEGLIRRNNSAHRTASQIDDFRAKVDNAHISELPFLTTTYLDIVFKESLFRGSGFLITPNCVLTAGHNVYEADLTGHNNGYWADTVTVIPALHETANGVDMELPYGQQTSEDFRVNSFFTTDTNNLSEYDYGAIFLDTPFVGIDTFMPLEFNHVPDVVLTTGYPGHPYEMKDSYDMWFSFGNVLGVRGENNNIINFAGYVSSGNSGGPIAYFNKTAKEFRLVGVVTWEDYLYDSGIRFTDLNRNVIMSWWAEEPQGYAYNHDYYVPFYMSSGSVWTGLALANPNDNNNHILIQYFSPQGDVASTKIVSLTANAQLASPCHPGSTYPVGWIKVSSTLPLYGLALMGNSAPSTMFDMDLQGSLHKKFIFPHLAADGKEWKSLAILCNPNANTASVSLSYYPQEGTPVIVRRVTIPKQGSVNKDLKQLFSHNLDGGHIIVQSTQPLAAFLLYDSSIYGKNNWKAGLSAVPMD